MFWTETEENSASEKEECTKICHVVKVKKKRSENFIGNLYNIRQLSVINNSVFYLNKSRWEANYVNNRNILFDVSQN